MRNGRNSVGNREYNKPVRLQGLVAKRKADQARWSSSSFAWGLTIKGKLREVLVSLR